MFKELFTESEKIMKYTREDNKTIDISYKVKGNKAYFKVPASELKDSGKGRVYSKAKMSDEISVSKDRFLKEFDPELEIFNWLKSINY